MAAWKEVLGARDKEAKERYLEPYKEEEWKVKSCIYKSKKDVKEQLGRDMNQDVNGNRKLFRKDVSKENRGKVESWNRMKDENGKLALGEVEVRRVWKEYF